MKTPLLAPALVLAAAVASAGMQTTTLNWQYAPGAASPSLDVRIKRQFTLLEWAALDALEMSRFDAAADAAGTEFHALRRSLDQADVDRIVQRGATPVSERPMADLAARLRSSDGALRHVAVFYLAQTEGARLTAERRNELTGFEIQLLESYLPFAPQNVYDKFNAEANELIFPAHTAAAASNRPQRIAVYRTFLRGEMSRYLDNVPAAGAAIDYQGEFSGLAVRARPIVDSTPNPAFLAAFTPLEQSVLDQMMTLKREEFAADQLAAAASSAQMDALVKKWRGRVLALSRAYLSSAGVLPAPAAGSDADRDLEMRFMGHAGRADGRAATTLGQLDYFETGYLESRLGRFDASYWGRFQALAQQADAAVEHGDARAGIRLVSAVYAPLRADLKAYVDANGTAPADTALKTWAEANLRSGATLAQAAPASVDPAPPSPAAPAAPIETDRFAALVRLLGSREEAAVADQLLSTMHPSEATPLLVYSSMPADDPQRLAAAAEWHQKAAAAMRDQLVHPDAAMTQHLQRFGLSDAALKTYYCARSAASPAPAGSTALGQLATAAQAAAPAAPGAEAAAASVSFERTPEIARLCAPPAPAPAMTAQSVSPAPAATSAATAAAAAAAAPATPSSSVALTAAPPKKPSAAAPPSPGNDKGSGDGMSDSTRGALIGAGVGALAAVALGLGPAGILGLFAIGLVYGLAITS